MTTSDSTYTTGDDNQTTSDGTYSYVYDAEGNLIAKYVDEDADGILDSGDTDITEYSWDYRNRLTEAAHRDLFGGVVDWTAQYDYDAFDHRIASRYDNDGDGVADEAYHYVWEGERVVLDFVDSDGGDNSLNDGASSASPALATRYLWGRAVDQFLAQETADDGGKEDVSYIVRDNLGSTRSLVNSSGTITATYSYDAYGNVTALVGSLSATRFLYTCQEYDATTGLYYYNARWYDASLGKFISQDPMSFAAGDANLYRYVGNGVTSATDPSGLQDTRLPLDAEDAYRMGLITAKERILLNPYTRTRLLHYIRVKLAKDAVEHEKKSHYLYWFSHSGQMDDDLKIIDSIAKNTSRIAGTTAGVGWLTSLHEVSRQCAASVIDLPVDSPLPPGWNSNWTCDPASARGNGFHWYDPEGGEWRWHGGGSDPWHGFNNEHWDYNPWDTWNSEWQNIFDEGGCNL